MRLIDAEAFDADIIKRYCKHCDNGKGLRCRVCWINDMLCELEEAPTIEAKPVVHAHWEWVKFEDGRDYFELAKCSNCGAMSAREYPYCRECGAQMDESISCSHEDDKPISQAHENGVKIPVIGMEDVTKLMKD